MEKTSASAKFHAGAAAPEPHISHAALSSRATGGPLSWVELLNNAIESEILPRLLSAQLPASRNDEFADDFFRELDDAGIADFVDLIVADDMEQAHAIADRLIVQTGSRDSLLEDLLAPAAKLLGLMWEQDTVDFVTVTLAVYRLDQIMKQTASAGGLEKLATAHEHHILLLPVPGEQHNFGLGMIADTFRQDGWCVRSGPAMARGKLLNLVREEWFDVIGFSVSTDRWLRGLPSYFRAIRAASCNQRGFLMAGGSAIANQPERTRFLGIDATAINPRDALAQANKYMETTVTPGLHQSNNRLIEFG